MSIILPESYFPKEDEEYMNPYQLQYFKNKLLMMKNNLLSVGDELENTIYDIRSSDSVESAVHEVDMHMELSDKQNKYQNIKNIDNSLLRIFEDRYGYCEMFGSEIGLKRLSIDPTIKYCIEAQEEMDNSPNEY